VTDARKVQRYGGGSGEYFELRYAFTVPGRTDTFTLEDATSLKTRRTSSRAASAS
jgi:hypothetical protein